MSMFHRTWFLVPAAALIGAGAIATPAFAASGNVTFPSTITVGRPFTFKVSHIPSGTSYVFGGLDGEDNQAQGYSFGYTPITGQSSATITATIPKTMTFGNASNTTRGGPREVDVYAGSQLLYAGVVNVAGVPTDRQTDAQSPYHMTYNGSTSKVTIGAVPSGASYVQIYYRKKGAPENDNRIVGSMQSIPHHASHINLSVAGIPTAPGYLEAEFIGSDGKTVDTNEVPVTQGLPVGQAPEVPWAAGIPVIGLAVGASALWRRRVSAT